jgi:hypothetical protein
VIGDEPCNARKDQEPSEKAMWLWAALYNPQRTKR